MPQTKGTVLDKPSWYGPARPALVLELLWEAVLHEEGSEEQKGTEPPPRPGQRVLGSQPAPDTLLRDRARQVHGLNFGVDLCGARSWTRSLWAPSSPGHSVVL